MYILSLMKGMSPAHYWRNVYPTIFQPGAKDILFGTATLYNPGRTSSSAMQMLLIPQLNQRVVTQKLYGYQPAEAMRPS